MFPWAANATFPANHHDRNDPVALFALALAVYMVSFTVPVCYLPPPLSRFDHVPLTLG
jgi:hypothetical protein